LIWVGFCVWVLVTNFGQPKNALLKNLTADLTDGVLEPFFTQKSDR